MRILIFFAKVGKLIAIIMMTLIATIIVAIIGIPLLLWAGVIEVIDYLKKPYEASEEHSRRDMRDKAAAEDSASAGN